VLRVVFRHSAALLGTDHFCDSELILLVVDVGVEQFCTSIESLVGLSIEPMHTIFDVLYIFIKQGFSNPEQIFSDHVAVARRADSVNEEPLLKGIFSEVVCVQVVDNVSLAIRSL